MQNATLLTGVLILGSPADSTRARVAPHTCQTIRTVVTAAADFVQQRELELRVTGPVCAEWHRAESGS